MYFIPVNSRRRRARCLMFCAAASLWPARGQAQGAVDKNQYSLFDPTPDNQLRSFSTDRPGNADSPFTVDAGHVQVETDLWDYSWDHWTPDASTNRSYTLASPNLKLGVNDWAELDAILPLYNSMVMRTPGSQTQSPTRSSGQGFGDVQLGGKVNFFGNDGKGDTGLGAVVFVKLPTAASGLGNNMVEFTTVVPYELALPGDFSLTIEPGVGLLRNGQKQGYHGDYQFITSFSREIPGTQITAELGLTLDRQGDHNSAEQNTISPSLQWLILPALQLDAGAFIGLNRGATDWEPYVGISFRY